MNVYLISGPAEVGKSSLILAQYKRLMSSNDYVLVENENPHSLNDFRYLLQSSITGECILLNSPTDDSHCIDDFEAFYNKHRSIYNITTIITSIRDKSINPNFNRWTMEAINRMAPTNIYTIDLSPLSSII